MLNESIAAFRTAQTLVEAGLKELERRGEIYTNTMMRPVKGGQKLGTSSPGTTAAKTMKAAYKAASSDLRYFAKIPGGTINTPEAAKALAATHAKHWAKYTKPKAAAHAKEPGADPRYGGHGWRKMTTGEKRADKKMRRR